MFVNPLTRLRRLARDGRGAAAVEFALIAPVLIALYFGLAEYCQAMMADRKISHVAASLGDLVAQTTQVSDADLADIFKLGPTLIAPFPSAKLQLRVTSVTVNQSNVGKVDWSKGSGLPDLTAQSTVTLPTNAADPTKPFIDKGESVIMSEATYTYDSPVTFFIPNGLSFSEKYYLRPRKSNVVAHVN